MTAEMDLAPLAAATFEAVPVNADALLAREARMAESAVALLLLANFDDRRLAAFVVDAGFDTAKEMTEAAIAAQAHYADLASCMEEITARLLAAVARRVECA